MSAPVSRPTPVSGSTYQPGPDRPAAAKLDGQNHGWGSRDAGSGSPATIPDWCDIHAAYQRLRTRDYSRYLADTQLLDQALHRYDGIRRRAELVLTLAPPADQQTAHYILTGTEGP